MTSSEPSQLTYSREAGARASPSASMKAMNTSSGRSSQAKISLCGKRMQLSCTSICTLKWSVSILKRVMRSMQESRLSVVLVRMRMERKKYMKTVSMMGQVLRQDSMLAAPSPNSPKNSMMSCLNWRSLKTAVSSPSSKTKAKLGSLMMSSILRMYCSQSQSVTSKQSLRYWQQKTRMLACGSPWNTFTTREGSTRFVSKKEGSLSASTKIFPGVGTAKSCKLRINDDDYNLHARPQQKLLNPLQSSSFYRSFYRLALFQACQQLPLQAGPV